MRLKTFALTIALLLATALAYDPPDAAMAVMWRLQEQGGLIVEPCPSDTERENRTTDTFTACYKSNNTPVRTLYAVEAAFSGWHSSEWLSIPKRASRDLESWLIGFGHRTEEIEAVVIVGSTTNHVLVVVTFGRR